MARKPTAQDVAEAAGVSLSTVDRVLNNRGGVAEAKETRVLRAARALKLDRALDQRAARTLRVAVLIQPPANAFHAALGAAVDAENHGPNPFNFQFRVFHIDPARPDRTAARILKIEADYDALMICVADQAEVAAALRQVSDRGKPVLALATHFGEDMPHIYVGPDNLRAGRVAGELMGRLLGTTGGDVVVISGMFSMTGHGERVRGFRAVLAERHPACRVSEVLESLEQGERAGALVRGALERNPAVRGIYNASSGAGQIVDVLERLGLSRRIVFITHELTERRRRLLGEGLIDAILDQNPVLEVRVAVEALAAHFGRLEKAPATTITPVQIHMIENC